MTIQQESHRCERTPNNVWMSRVRIDGKSTVWAVTFGLSSTPLTLSARLDVRYCPWCGKELDDGR